MKNSFFNSFVPKQPNFFCLLKQLADILSEAADVLTESVEQGKPEERETYYRRCLLYTSRRTEMSDSHDSEIVILTFCKLDARIRLSGCGAVVAHRPCRPDECE